MRVRTVKQSVFLSTFPMDGLGFILYTSRWGLNWMTNIHILYLCMCSTYSGEAARGPWGVRGGDNWPDLHNMLGGNQPQSRQNAKLFLQSSILGLPQPHTRRRVCPPPLWYRGEGHTRWRERGWESPNSDEVTYTVQCAWYSVSTVRGG
jgi:hypothetical protein